jgi:hypothetical protein
MNIKGIIIIALIALIKSGLLSAENGYSVQIIGEKVINQNNKVVGSSISLITEFYIPGTTMDLMFYYTYSSPDYEWDDGVSLDFPEGVFVNDASVCAETGAQQLPFNGESGDGALVTWGNILGGSGFGGLRSSGQFWVNVTISEDFADSLHVDWFIAGDGFGADPNFAQGSISLPRALDYDLEIADIQPTFVMLGNNFVPVVTIRNMGIYDAEAFSVELQVPGFDYTEQLHITDILVSGQTVQILFPPYTPLQAMDYVATAIITNGGGEDQSNDTLTVHGKVAPLAEAYAINGFNLTYNEIDLLTGNMIVKGSVDPSQWQMAEEFDGKNIYRINAHGSIGTVDHEGNFYYLGDMTGVPGWAGALAWNWDNDMMYVVMQNEQTDYSHICTLDMETFELTEIGVNTELILGMDFANDGYLYAVTFQNNLLKIDPVTAETTVVGPIGIDIVYPQDVSYDVETGLLYTIASGFTFSYFGTYDLNTGAFQMIKDMQSIYYYTLVITKNPNDYIPVTFNVDMSSATDFNAGIDHVYISGSMNAWAEPGTDDKYLLSATGEDMIYSVTFDLNKGNFDYKYYINSGWDGAEWGDNIPGRTLEVVDAAIVLNDVWGQHPGEYYPVTFHVDMSTALSFSEISDKVYLSGSMNEWAEPGTDNYYLLSHIGEDLVYSTSIYLGPGNYDYKFFINSGWDGAEWGDDIPDRSFEVIDSDVVLYDVWGDHQVTIVNKLLHNLKIFPNPTSDYIYIESDVVLGKVQLYNLAGHMVFSQKINKNDYRLNVSDFQTGLYLVRFSLFGGEILTTRILIAR